MTESRTKVQVLVKLATVDPWSFTVLDSLRCKFGLTQVVDVSRLKSWELGFAAAGETHAVAEVQDLLRSTALLANPNRDVWFVRGDTRQAVPSSIWGGAKEGSEAFVIKVRDRDDIIGRSVAAVLGSRLHMGDVGDVIFSTIWIVEMVRGERVPAELAGEIAVATAWRRGLLSNPNSQSVEVMGAIDYLKAGVPTG